MLTTGGALILTLVMGPVILFCRIFPFLFFRGETHGARRDAFLSFVEKIVPEAAMTVLAFNAVAAPFKSGIGAGVPALLAALFTAAVHLWKRNSLLSIFGGTALYIVLGRILYLFP
ncbi:MAG: AzlD domain-containing protein [Treponema sp.]|jgi:branched-subunit amino acid transport protein AzlD|nr:AzlD domain-containing protein [Treponema sp.]